MIDAKLQAELRAKFNPDGSELRELQLRMLDILRYIDGVCKEHNITYWLSSGTCLGAVRHGGFIPWDDDVDIEMLRPDYEKFCAIMSSSPCRDYQLQTFQTDAYFIQDFAKVRCSNYPIVETSTMAKYYKHKGLFVDIFCMEPSNSKIIHYICGRLRVMEYVIAKFLAPAGYIGLCLIKSLHWLNDCIMTCCRPFDSYKSRGRLRQKLGSPFIRSRFLSDIVPPQKHRFEDVDLPIPFDYNKYLTGLFGDYMNCKIEHSHIVYSD